MNLRAIAERVLAIDPQDLNRESVCNGKAGSNITLDELEDAHNLARAVLSSLDVPDDVREAMERFRKCRAPDTAVAKLAAWDTVYQGLHPDQNGRDLEAIISWALANPIRIDVPNCEQLLRDVELAEQTCIDEDECCTDPWGHFIEWDYAAAVKNLAAHTRRTLGEK